MLIFRYLSKAGSQFAVVMLNDGWFNRNEALMIHAQNSILRAVENRFPIVRVANSGWSCSIDKLGKIDWNRTLPLNQKGVVGFSIEPSIGKTFYSRFGDIFAQVCLGFVFISFMVRFKRKREL